MSDKKPDQRQSKGISPIAVLSALISILFCSFIISVTIINKTNVERMSLEQQIYERIHRISETISKLLYKTQALAATVIHDNGGIDSFEITAPSIVDDPVIQNVLLAPDGIVKKIYPLNDNIGILNWDYLSDGPGNKEAAAALDMGQLVMAGPLKIPNGEQAIFGRLPVYIDNQTEKNNFWGIVSVALKFPQVLEYAELEIFDTHNIAYELWRVNPDTNERQVIATNYQKIKPSLHFVEKRVQILNADWYLRISPIKEWYSNPENIALIFAGFFISFIVFSVMQNNHELKGMQVVFKQLATTDPLTGIFNRRHFLEVVRSSLEKSRRYNEDCYFILFDIDKFKDVNDTFGHIIGDKVLVDVTTRIKNSIRPYDLFARYGGEEFMIFISDANNSNVREMTERLRLSLCDKKYEYDDISVSTSASFGIAPIIDYNLDKAIIHSDEALYEAKRNGRNCVVYYTEKNTEKSG